MKGIISARSCPRPCEKVPPFSFDKRRLQRACQLSQLSYLPREAVLNDHGLSVLPTLSDIPHHYDGSENITRKSGLQAYTWRFEEEGQLWIGFNGTMNLTTLLEHIRCKRVPLVLPNHPELMDVQAHAGFVEHFSWLQSELERDLLRTLSSRVAIRELVFTGHSSGSCAAQVAALYFGSLLLPVRPDLRVSHIGFGAPRLGSGRHLVDAFNACVSEHTLVVNQHDIVPNLPPSKWGFSDSTPFQLWLYDGTAYKKTGECECAIDEDDPDSAVCSLGLLGPGWKGMKTISDHSLTQYMKGLEDCFEDV